MLLALATVELYRMAPDFDRLFPEVMTERYAMTDPEHLAAARQGVPTLPTPGHWVLSDSLAVSWWFCGAA